MGYDYSESIARVLAAEAAAKKAGVCTHAEVRPLSNPGKYERATGVDIGQRCVACGEEWSSFRDYAAARREAVVEFL